METSSLTTHGVIVGMTGSGKTGLGIVLLEEVLLAGLPALILDPKGDMGNLLLTFPDLAGPSFEPWVSEQDARREGRDVVTHARHIATMWREGLASWGIPPARLARLRQNAPATLYTPGSTAGVPLNIIGSLKAPAHGGDIEAQRDEIEGFVSSLLALVGIHGDPISCREHILLANLIEHAWQQGRDLDLAMLLHQVQEPPLRRLGVIDLDTFFPRADRRDLAMRLNGLLASPAFGAWMEGPPLDIETLLYDDGRPRAAVITLAHLSDDERQLVVTLILSKLVTWMRAQPGSDDLRALVYMDEVFGFVPPTKAPPSKKPILTILKQARAFGVGMVLATQNPVDVDYKALSNAGTWLIGRLQTERDKARLLDGLVSAGGQVSARDIGRRIAGLEKRQFLYHSTKAPTPTLFGTRWAMAYLPGPMTRDEIGRLTAHAPERAAAPPAPNTAPETAAPPDARPDGTTPIPPEVAPGTPVFYLDRAADWHALPAYRPESTTLGAALAARVHLVFDDDRAGVRHTETWEAVVYPLAKMWSADDAVALDYDERDLVAEAPATAHYLLPDAPIHTKTFFKRAATTLKNHLYHNRSVTLFRNRELKLYARVGESREAFEARCQRAAEEAEEAAAAKLHQRYEKRIDSAEDRLSRARERLAELEVNRSTRRTDEMVSGVGSLLTAFLGGRSKARTLASGLRQASSKRSQSRRAAQRVTSASARVEALDDALEDLELELADELTDLDLAWSEKALAIEDLEIGLEKTDIQVDQLALVWIPVSA